MKYISMILAFLIIPCLFIDASNQQGKIDLFADKDLSRVFSAKEIESLSLMISFVDSAVVAITNNENVADAYHGFFDAYGNGLKEVSKKITPFDEKEKYDFLKSLDKGAFEAIWRFNTHIDRLRYKDTILINVDYVTCLEVNPLGRYMEYIEQVGKKDERYKDLHDFIFAMGDLSISTGLWTVHEKFDFSIVKNRIFAAIYILRIEDAYATKLDRFF